MPNLRTGVVGRPGLRFAHGVLPHDFGDVHIPEFGDSILGQEDIGTLDAIFCTFISRWRILRS